MRRPNRISKPDTENVEFTITFEDDDGVKVFDVECKARIYTEPFEPADRYYPGCPGGSTVEEVDIIGHPDQESVIKYVNLMGGTTQDFVEEDDPSGILFDVHRDKGVVIDTFNSDTLLEYLRGKL